jgi:hypothetical protein
MTQHQITKNYNSEYEDLIQQSRTMQKQLNQIIPKNILNISTITIYEDILENFTKSVELELESNKHFANYISSGNQSENQRSIDILSQADISENQILDSYKSLP